MTAPLRSLRSQKSTEPYSNPYSAPYLIVVNYNFLSLELKVYKVNFFFYFEFISTVLLMINCFC